LLLPREYTLQSTFLVINLIISLKHIPSCIYTTPEVASVGFTEEQLIEKGLPSYKVSKISLAGNGKARILGYDEGFVKILYDPKYGEILGVI
jgi:dihydrolipoamide dehydrogenase